MAIIEKDELIEQSNYPERAKKKQITIRLDYEIIEYFKKLADEYGMKYQSLINLYLKECTKSKSQLSFQINEKSVKNTQKTNQ